MTHLALLLIVLAILTSVATPFAAQAVIDPTWDRTAVSQLTVAIRRTPSAPCFAAGFLVGADDRATYVVTAAESLQVTEVAAGTANEIPTDSVMPTLLVSLNLLVPLPASARALPAIVLHTDTEMGISVLAIRDAPLAQTVARLVSFDLAGDRAGLVRADPVYALGCTDTALFAEWPPRPITALSRRDDRIVFRGGDLMDGRIGGPLVHVLGAHPTIIGLVTVFRERAEARGIDLIVQRLRGWKVPVALRPPGSTPDCKYSLSFSRAPAPLDGVNMIMFSSNANESVTVTVETGATCSWTAYGDASDWMRVSISGGSKAPPNGRVLHTGPSTVTLTTVKANQCENNFKRGSVVVAGQLIPVGQDSTNLGRCG